MTGDVLRYISLFLLGLILGICIGQAATGSRLSRTHTGTKGVDKDVR